MPFYFVLTKIYKNIQENQQQIEDNLLFTKNVLPIDGITCFVYNRIYIIIQKQIKKSQWNKISRSEIMSAFVLATAPCSVE